MISKSKKLSFVLVLALSTVSISSTLGADIQDCLKQSGAINTDGSLTQQFASCIDSDVTIVNNGLSTTAGTRTITLPTVTCSPSGTCDVSSINQSLSNNEYYSEISSATLQLDCHVTMGTADIETRKILPEILPQTVNGQQYFFNYDGNNRGNGTNTQYDGIVGETSSVTPELLNTTWVDSYGAGKLFNSDMLGNNTYHLLSAKINYIQNNQDHSRPIGIQFGSASADSDRENVVYACKLDFSNIVYINS